MFHSNPPTNVVDTILVHLRDASVVVHQAAVRAVDWRPWWFNESQAWEALNCLAALVYAYRTDPYELEHICGAAMALGRKHASFRRNVLGLVESIFPTSNEHVDRKLAEEMLRMTNVDDAISPRVAVHLATYLAAHKRDRMNSYRYTERDRMFMWMHELPQATVAAISDHLLVRAIKLAHRDFWESWQFASLFAKNQLYSYERRTLEAIHNSYPAEPRFDDNRSAVTELIALSATNERLLFAHERCRASPPNAQGDIK
jgi:hypothetical protein